MYTFQLQRDNSNVADACDQWIQVRDGIPLVYRNNDYFKEKMTMGMTEVAITAHMLHPHYKGMLCLYLENY